MTIAHSGSTQGGDNTTPVAHTTPAIGAQRINIAVLSVRSDLGIGRNIPNLPTYGGIAMTQLATVRWDPGGQGGDMFAYYQVAPLTGPNNLALTFAAGFAGISYCMAISSYLYVDQVTPFFGAPVTGSGIGAGGSVVVPSQTDQLVVDWLGLVSTNAASGVLVPGAGQTLRNSNTTDPVGGGRPGDGMSEEQGALSVTMSWAWTGADVGWALIASPLRPAVDPRTRAVKYFFNIWDPTHTIKDGIGNITPNEVRADNWIETDGFTLGESATYPDFIKDPTKSRIVSITYRRSGVDIKVSKSAFADVIIARAAAGRM
jgi:hypothetical protein